MNDGEQTLVSHLRERPFTGDLSVFHDLADLDVDICSSWNHVTDQVWPPPDPVLWELTDNPWVVLQTVSPGKPKLTYADLSFLKIIEDLVQARREAAEASALYHQASPQSAPSCVAYFSVELIISEALPIYPRGQGNLARDHYGAKDLFDPRILMLGFVRRFTNYKSPHLLLRNQERLLRILTNPDRLAQFIIAGKAHPQDTEDQALIQESIPFIRQTGVRPHAVFLSDYDMLLTDQLVQGANVWLNTPRRPWEAYGTSAMKVLIDGGINLSELDGWWAEAYTPEVGWALGDGQQHHDDPAWDVVEAEPLYDLLEQEVIPKFYAGDESDISTGRVNRMRESMAQLTPHFSTNRLVREYTEKYYLPAAVAYRARMEDKGKAGQQIVDWRNSLG